MLISDIITKRKSVRTFDGRPVSAEDRTALEKYISTLKNPFDVPVEFFLLDAKENGLTSPVIIGEGMYIAAKVRKVQNHEIAFGYSFEAVCLHALSMGIGTVMLAASINRPVFEKVIGVRDDEVMPVASPAGYPAEKRSIRENLMRKGIKADTRIPFEQLFFDGSFKQSLAEDSVFAHALEMARWAPSAANRQPTRAVVDGDSVHFYEAKSMRDNNLGDIQKVDIGIALSHFDLTLKEEGISGQYVFADPGMAAPDNTKYIVTFVKG